MSVPQPLPPPWRAEHWPTVIVGSGEPLEEVRAGHMGPLQGDPFETAVRVAQEANEHGVPLKLLGGHAVRLLCPDFPHRARHGQDIDFASISSAQHAVVEFLSNRRFQGDQRFNLLHGDRQMFFRGPDGATSVDAAFLQDNWFERYFGGLQGIRAAPGDAHPAASASRAGAQAPAAAGHARRNRSLAHSRASAAVAAWRRERDRPPGQRLRYLPPGAWHRTDRVGGMLVLAASARELKSWAVAVARLGDWLYYGMDYTDLSWPDGEVQVFTDYRRRVGTAQTTCREILAGPARQLPTAD